MLGRAAITIRLPGWKPVVRRFELLEPGRHPGDIGAGLVQRRDPLERVLEQLLDVGELAGDPLLGEIEDDRLGAVDKLLGGHALTLEPEPCDLLPGSDEATERGHLPDDARVVTRVGGGGNERCELVDPGTAADLLELATTLELVRQGDRVDRLALRVEVERRLVHGGVARPVEVACREDFADRPIAPGESIIAPRTDSSASRFCGGTGAVGEASASWYMRDKSNTS